LLLEVDPVGLVRKSRGHSADTFTLGQYVNDRPYAASSLLAVALSRMFKTAMAGRCDARPQAAATPLPLELHIPALPCRGNPVNGPALAEALFTPLGWQVAATPVPLDPQFPGWGDSRYVDLRLSGTVRLADALNHLYVLLPVLDDAKHYWVSTDDIDKLIRAGQGWLASHPERDLITRRYLAHQGGMQRTALARLADVDDAQEAQIDNATDGPDLPEPAPAPKPGQRAAQEPAPSLAELRADAVLAALHEAGAHSVADLGCGDGRLLARLAADPAFDRVIGTDVSVRALEQSARRLDRLAGRQRERAVIFQSSLVYIDTRLAGLDAAVLMEVIEHVDPPRLPALARAVFGAAAPATVIVTTPNAEHNARYPGLAPGAFRHRDHRFEWTRAQFRAWAEATAASHGYTVTLRPAGADDPDVGPPSQLAIFTRSPR
jgi:3' terminal RNA ribose 2'-O-methyltransferase Hen1